MNPISTGHYNNSFPYYCYPAGDHAVTFSFGDTVDSNVNAYILQLFDHCKKNTLPGIKDCIPAYTTLTIVYDALYFLSKNIDPIAAIQQYAEEIRLPAAQNKKNIKKEITRIPVCYEAACAPDIASLALSKKLSIEELIDLHIAVTYRVFMNGFLPGFAYMGKVDEKIHAPRLTAPRQKVPAGSVGIAGDQTGIYPIESPGGWQLIGQTPLLLFNIASSKPCLLEPGDLVQFYPISFNEFKNWSAQ